MDAADERGVDGSHLMPFEMLGSVMDSEARRAWLRAARASAKWSQSRLAKRLRVSQSSVGQWESRHPGRAVPSIDRLEQISKLLKVALPEHWHREIGAQRALKLPVRSPLRRRSVPKQAGAASVSGEIRAVARVLASIAGIPRYLDRNAELFAQRYGVMGPDAATLQACGDRFGMTRERARQICERMLERGRAFGIEWDRTQSLELAEVVRQSHPMSIEGADEAFRGRLGEALGIADARRFAGEVLGVKLPFVLLPVRIEIPGPPEGLLFVPGDLPEWVECAVTHAKRLVRHSGAAHLNLLYALVVHELRAFIDPAEFRHTLTALPRFQWLGEPWFWFGPEGSGNRMVDRAIELLAVAGRHVDIETIHAGLSRYTRTRVSAISDEAGVLVPVGVLLEVLKASPEFIVKQTDDVALAKPVSPDTLLSDSACALYEFMHARGGVAARSELNAAFIRTSRLNPVTMSVTLAIHPIFRQLDRGLFALRGRPLQFDRMVDAARSVGIALAADGSRPPVHTAAVAEDGSVRFEFKITAGSVRNRLTHIPAWIRPALKPGAYRVDGGGRVVVPGGGKDELRGAVTAALRSGASIGDSWLLTLWSDAGRATVARLESAENAPENAAAHPTDS